MTNDEAIEAAIDAMISARVEGEGAAIRAAAPILIQHGRELAAQAIGITADDEAARPGRDCASRLIEEWLREAAGIARGGTP